MRYGSSSWRRSSDPEAVPIGCPPRDLDAQAPFLVIIGVSASGKSTVARRLHRDGVIHLTPSWTTRPRRADERGRTPEHQFVSEERFDELTRAGFFLDVVKLFDLPYRYGLPRIEQSREALPSAILLRADLIALLRRHYARPVVYHIDVDDGVMAARLSSRGEPQPGMRIDGARAERKLGNSLATRTFFNTSTIDELISDVKAAIARDFAGSFRPRSAG